MLCRNNEYLNIVLIHKKIETNAALQDPLLNNTRPDKTNLLPPLIVIVNVINGNSPVFLLNIFVLTAV